VKGDRSSLRSRILYLQYTNPAGYPPIEHGAGLFVDAGCDVVVLAVVGAADRLRFTDRPHVRVRIMRGARPGWRQKLHYARFLLWTCWWAWRWVPTCVYVSDPLAAPAGLFAARLFGRRVVYHEHDAPASTRPTRFFRFVLSARRALARRAVICVVPNATRAAAFTRDTGAGRVVVVWNCPRRGEVMPPREAWTPPVVRVLYQGSIVPARLPVAVVEAVGRVPAIDLTVVGYETAGAPGYGRTLLDHAARAGAAGRVRLAGAMPTRAELMRNCATFDVGLSLLPERGGDVNEEHMTGASNKPFDYLACGLAVLVSDRADWRSFYVDAGVARACRPESSESVADALAWFVTHADEMRAMGERGRRRVADAWCYDEVFAPVLAAALQDAR
jgi:glycosyltransferase involved in cell wall biosynthesis